MKTYSSTVAQNKFGMIIEESGTEPITITSYGKAVAVVVSIARYQQLEDEYWSGKIEEAIKEGFLDQEEMKIWQLKSFQRTKTLNFIFSKSSRKFLNGLIRLQKLKIVSSLIDAEPTKLSFFVNNYYKIDSGKFQLIFDIDNGIKRLIFITKTYC